MADVKGGKRSLTSVLPPPIGSIGFHSGSNRASNPQLPRDHSYRNCICLIITIVGLCWAIFFVAILVPKQDKGDKSSEPTVQTTYDEMADEDEMTPETDSPSYIPNDKSTTTDKTKHLKQKYNFDSDNGKYDGDDGEDDEDDGEITTFATTEITQSTTKSKLKATPPVLPNIDDFDFSDDYTDSDKSEDKPIYNYPAEEEDIKTTFTALEEELPIEITPELDDATINFEVPTTLNITNTPILVVTTIPLVHPTTSSLATTPPIVRTTISSGGTTVPNIKTTTGRIEGIPTTTMTDYSIDVRFDPTENSDKIETTTEHQISVESEEPDDQGETIDFSIAGTAITNDHTHHTTSIDDPHQTTDDHLITRIVNNVGSAISGIGSTITTPFSFGGNVATQKQNPGTTISAQSTNGGLGQEDHEQ